MKALGKKMLWIGRSNMHFETDEDFNRASDEEKNLSVYKIIQRNSKEAFEFKRLQKKKWDWENYKKDIKNKKDNINFVKRFTMKDQKNMDEIQSKVERNLIDESDVICCTIITSAKKTLLDCNFDYVIIDEASQSDQIVSLIPFIHNPTKLILLGDDKQLDPNVPTEELKQKHPRATKSLYVNLMKKKVASEMLNQQFRMNPYIAEFPNRLFYGNKIQCDENLEKNTRIDLVGLMTPIMFIDVKDGFEKRVYGTTYENVAEAEATEIILHNLQKNKIPGNQVGIITPYSGQSELLRPKLKQMKYIGIRVSCVDSFQGTERDYIILSLVRTNRYGRFGFITNENRINVSLTRARKGLFIVGNYNAIISSNKKNNHPENMILIKLCQFYKELGAVVDSKKIQKIDTLKSIRINHKYMHPLPLKKLTDNSKDANDFWKDITEL